MIETQYCPSCQRRNLATATHCSHCGVALDAPGAHTFSTVSTEAGPPVRPGSPVRARCAELLSGLPPEAVVLDLGSEAPPIVIQDATSVVLGRSPEGAGPGYVDLSPLGEMAHAISRHHARLTLQDATFMLEDLDSTNGTWVNRMRLSPGTGQPLHNQDVVFLGPVKITVCLDPERTVLPLAETSEIWLKARSDAAATAPRVTPDYLAQTILPLLQALATVNQIMVEAELVHPSTLTVRSLMERGGLVTVFLLGGADALSRLLRQLVPWRAAHLPDSFEAEMDLRHVFADEIRQLAETLLTPLPDQQEPPGDASPPDRDALTARLLPPLELLATTPVALIDPGRSDTVMLPESKSNTE